VTTAVNILQFLATSHGGARIYLFEKVLRMKTNIADGADLSVFPSKKIVPQRV
jgi:hypothetical protein